MTDNSVGEPITLHMITPLFTPGTKDLEVIHSFWVPEWGVKQDATPGVSGKQVGTTYVKPTRVGTYEVQCTELCGSGHGEIEDFFLAVGTDVHDAIPEHVRPGQVDKLRSIE